MIAEGSGPPVLLLHGSGPGTTAAAWAPLIAALAPHHRVIAPDLLGFGLGPAARRLAAIGLDGAGGRAARRARDRDVRGRGQLGRRGDRAARSRTRARVRSRASSRWARWGIRCRCPAGLDELWGYATEPRGGAGADRAAQLRPGGGDAGGDRGAPAGDARPAALSRPVPGAAPALGRRPRRCRASELAAITAPVLLVHGAQDRVVPLRDSVLPLLRAAPGRSRARLRSLRPRERRSSTPTSSTAC